MLKLSLLVLLLVVAVNCRRLSKLERLENVLSETDVMLKELKREVIAADETCQDKSSNCAHIKTNAENQGKEWTSECEKLYLIDQCAKSCDKCDVVLPPKPSGKPSETKPIIGSETTPSHSTETNPLTQPTSSRPTGSKPSGGPNPSSGTCDKQVEAILPSGVEDCTESNKGHCECAEKCGFKTYVFQSNGDIRCFTVYRPPKLTQQLSVVLASQCYGKDKLSGLLMANDLNDENKAAARYGFARIGLSTPDGAWQFGNDGIVNDEKPMPCSENDSKDAVYVNKVFEFINSNPSVFNSEKIYAEGFSQNSMFSAYIGFCHNEQVAGIWQGGSGMALSSQTELALPAKQVHCTASLWKEFEKDCVNQNNACPGCKYWPIYPCYLSKKPMVNCIADYNNDFIANSADNPETVSTAENMYEAMVNEGHDARLLRFQPSEPSQTIPGGHKNPQNTVYWQMGCWGMTEKCSSQCELSFIDCVGEQGPSTGAEKAAAFETCISEDIFSTLSGCEKSCSPTYDMLIRSEEPYKKELSKGIFGAGKDGAHKRPNTSKCEA